jgi:sugar phosphate isomerase/epimerase
MQSKQIMPATVQGPGLYIAQFIGTTPPFVSLEGIASWASGLGFRGLQIPTSNPAIFDLQRAAESDAYCDEVRGTLARHGLQLTELSSPRQGHLLAVNAAYDDVVDVFAPAELRGSPAARREWANAQLLLAARATKRLGLTRHATFSGSLLWPYFYPYPPVPEGLVEAGFTELARRWRPILDAFDTAGADLCFELHPGEDLHDGVTFERLLEKVDNHPRLAILYDPSHFLLQHLDYLGFIDRYHERIRCFHVKDAEFIPSARSGVYGGYQSWIERPGRFRSPGDGQVDFKGIFSRLARYGYAGWACLEWECCLKNSDDGAREGAAFISHHIIKVTDRAFDAGMAAGPDDKRNARLLGAVDGC